MSIYNPRRWERSRVPSGFSWAILTGSCSTQEACRCGSDAGVIAIMARYEKALQAVEDAHRRRRPRGRTRPGRSDAARRFQDVSVSGRSRGVRRRAARVRRELRAGSGRQARRRLRTFLDVEWVLIGPLQSNKTALAADVFDRIESIDRLKIAQRLSDARSSARPPLDAARAGEHQRRSDEERRRARGRGPARCGRRIVAAPRLRAASWASPHRPRTSRTQRMQFAMLRSCRDQARARGLRCDDAVDGHVRRTSKRRSPKARRRCASGRRSSALVPSDVRVARRRRYDRCVRGDGTRAGTCAPRVRTSG